MFICDHILLSTFAVSCDRSSRNIPIIVRVKVKHDQTTTQGILELIGEIIQTHSHVAYVALAHGKHLRISFCLECLCTQFYSLVVMKFTDQTFDYYICNDHEGKIFFLIGPV